MPSQKVVFQINLNKNLLGKFQGSDLSSSVDMNQESITKAISDVADLMSGMFGRTETQDCSVLSFDDNMVLVEFPRLAGSQQQELEQVTLELLQILFVNTVSAVYVDDQRLDLFGSDARKESSKEERRRRRREWESAHESEEDIRLEKEFMMQQKSRSDRQEARQQRKAEI